jgi:23S rRNA (guanine1835-N2)-methyltransferase
VALQPAAVWTDSALSVIAIRENLKFNGRKAVAIIPSTESPAGDYAGVIMRVPKVLRYFEYQLAGLAAVTAAGTPVLAAGMDKHLSPRVANLLEHYIGPTERRPGRQKARCFIAVRDGRPACAPPKELDYHFDTLEAPLVSLPNVFSGEKIDIGSRFLLDNLGQLSHASHLIDLACGNGILGLTAKARGLCESVAFCDESAMAVESARRNARQHPFHAQNDTRFHQGDGLLGYEGEQADLILCNPPFHANHTVDEFVGSRLLEQCAQHLDAGGRLCLVANRHLPYLPILKRGFSRVDKLAQNSKFIIWLARK